MEEIWKEYKTYGRYGCIRADLQISNYGNVIGTIRNKPVNITTIGGRRCVNTHHQQIYHLVWEVFNGPVPKGYVIHHIDHNKLNDRLDNLMMMTKSEHSIHHLTGRKASKETKEKMSKIHKGQIISEEQKLAISRANSGRKWNDEQRKHLSEARKGMKLTDNHKKKISISLLGNQYTKGMHWYNNGVINKMFRTDAEAFALGFKKGSLPGSLNKRKKCQQST